jgi:hypothetical protein
MIEVGEVEGLPELDRTGSAAEGEFMDEPYEEVNQ